MIPRECFTAVRTTNVACIKQGSLYKLTHFKIKDFNAEF